VRATGGLVDTVRQYDEARGEGTGFLFNDLTGNALYNVIGWALSTWYDRRAHVTKMQLEGMAQNFSWDRSAEQYEQVYRAAYQRRRGHPFPG
jgi:starch synthase